MSLPPSEEPANETTSTAELRGEMERYSRYLVGVPASPYQVQRYLDFHRQRMPRPKSAFDALVLRISQLGPVGLILADAYTGTLYRVCLLRVKLVVALAILECSPPSFHVIDTPSGSRWWTFVVLAMRTLRAAVALTCAALLIAPLHALCAVTGRTKHTMVKAAT